MKKKDLVDRISVKAGFSSKESNEIVESIFSLLKNTLGKGEEIKIPGFGSFYVKEKAPRRGRNPHTGEEIEIAARKILTFKPSRILRDAMNSDALNQAIRRSDS